jgi:hypothetical protein
MGGAVRSLTRTARFHQKNTPREWGGAFCSLTRAARFRLKLLQNQTAHAFPAHANEARFESALKNNQHNKQRASAISLKADSACSSKLDQKHNQYDGEQRAVFRLTPKLRALSSSNKKKHLKTS